MLCKNVGGVRDKIRAVGKKGERRAQDAEKNDDRPEKYSLTPDAKQQVDVVLGT